MYSENFKKLIVASSEKTYIGRGNPNANILFVGKEYSKPNEKAEFESKFWNEKIAKNEIVNLTHIKNVGEGHTWNKYQNLHDYIFEKTKTNKFDFEELIFTTEMSEIPQKNTINARKNPEFKPKLAQRKIDFFRSKFIQDFPVIVLACSDYITPHEIYDIFDVSFEIGGKFPNDDSNSMQNHFWVHYNKDKNKKPKLVIHTRQLSVDVSNYLLKEMGKVIRNHLKSIDLYNKNHQPLTGV